MPPTNTNSDSEDDSDYVPPADDNDSESSDEREDLEKAPLEAPKEDSDPATQKKQRDALWATFQASVSTPGVTPSESAPKSLVKIEKTYLFAGKHVTEVVEVPEDSEDAKKWPRWSPESGPVSEPPSSEVEANGTPTPTSTSTPTPGPTTTPTTTPVISSAATPASTSTAPKKPGPRKPRTALPSIPKASQAKKITTLDKSAMDWRAHVSSQSMDVKDELDANRRGGGYLEKVEFLKRVEGRRDDAFEANKASKRRKT